MRRVCLTSEEKQKVLAAELQQIKDTYEKLVESNLIVEKTLRDQKYRHNYLHRQLNFLLNFRLFLN